MDYNRRGGRGDRIGRYGNTQNDHNFRDMDYRGYEEAEAEYDVTADVDKPCGHGEQSIGAPDFSMGRLQDCLKFHKRGDGSEYILYEGKGLVWPTCSQPQPDLANTMLQRDNGRSRREFDHLQSGLQIKGQVVKVLPGTGALYSGSNKGNWDRGSALSEKMDHSTTRPIKEERFPHVAMNRRAFPVGSDEHGSGNVGPDLTHDEMDQWDQDYRADLDQYQRPSNIIMLRMLPPSATANEIRAQLQEQGSQPREVRLMRNKSSGQSRGFAFVEFNHIQEATRWMETNQGVLLILGQRVLMHYSDPKPRANEDWLCNKCGVQNFKRREKCFKCSVPKSEAELKLPQLPRDLPVGLQKDGAQGLLPLPVLYHSSGPTVTTGQAAQPTDVANDTLILRNLGPHTSVESILSALAQFATLSPSNIRLIKDKHTHLNRGFAFLQLSTIVEASQLLQILQALKPSLSIDGKSIVVEFAKGSKRDVVLVDGSRVNAAMVASTAIAAAQWTVTPTSHNGSAGGQSVDTVMHQQDAAVTYSQEGHEYVEPDGAAFKAQADTRIPALPNAGAALMATYMGGTAPAVVSSGELMSGSTVGQQPFSQNQTALITTAVAIPTTQVEIVGKPQPAAPSQPATPGTGHELQQYPVPDVSTYQYDESSGYYYDPLTGLYYDPNSQYYFNPHSQQYMYWDGENHTYISAAGQSNTEGVITSDSSVPSDSPFASLSSKQKKDKLKSKTAQQIAKDMERWAKSLNRQKENMRSVLSCPAVGSTALPPVYSRTHGRLNDCRESASADAGYAVLEKKGALSERHQICVDQIQQSEEQQQVLVPAYSGDTDSEEEGGDRNENEGRMTDWVKLACLLCRRQFPSKEALIRHQQLSELHKQNLEKRRSQQEAAGKERFAGGTEGPAPKKRMFSPIDGITGTSLGARMLQGGVKRGLLLRNMQVE